MTCNRERSCRRGNASTILRDCWVLLAFEFAHRRSFATQRAHQVKGIFGLVTALLCEAVTSLRMTIAKAIAWSGALAREPLLLISRGINFVATFPKWDELYAWGIPPPPRSLGIMGLERNCKVICGAQSLTGKLLISNNLRPVTSIPT